MEMPESEGRSELKVLYNANIFKCKYFHDFKYRRQ